MAFFDDDGNGSVSQRELEATRLQTRAELENKKNGVSETERGLLALALMVLENAGSGKVFASFDENGDGKIGRDEMFSDFRLDGRAFDDVVADPDAVDWQSFAARFGKPGKLFLPLLKAAGEAR